MDPITLFFKIRLALLEQQLKASTSGHASGERKPTLADQELPEALQQKVKDQ